MFGNTKVTNFGRDDDNGMQGDQHLLQARGFRMASVVLKQEEETTMECRGNGAYDEQLAPEWSFPNNRLREKE